MRGVLSANMCVWKARGLRLYLFCILGLWFHGWLYIHMRDWCDNNQSKYIKYMLMWRSNRVSMVGWMMRISVLLRYRISSNSLYWVLNWTKSFVDSPKFGKISLIAYRVSLTESLLIQKMCNKISWLLCCVVI